jgi:hypothetical protein
VFTEAQQALEANDPPYSSDNPSPSSLGEWGDHYMDSLWDSLDAAETAEKFYAVAAKLVFHARHMHPRVHAELAERLRMPFRRGRGNPGNDRLREAAEWASAFSLRPSLFHDNRPRHEVVAEIARQLGVSKARVNQAIREADRRLMAKKG